MCTLLLWKDRHPRYPAIVAANRDEFYDRPATGAQVLSADPLVVGGRDVTAGGSWFVVCASGLVVAVTNRRDAGKHDPSKSSRGSLVLQLAQRSSLEAALAQCARIDPARYNPFIILLADSHAAAAVHGGDDGLRVRTIGAGPHAMTNWDLDAPAPPKAQHALDVVRRLPIDPGARAGALAQTIFRALADHAAAGCALCVHAPERAYGTRSSTIAFLGTTPADTKLYDAQGPPCTSLLEEKTALLYEGKRSLPMKN